jgi:outer membrane murein-binding lipoprotein Lpp
MTESYDNPSTRPPGTVPTNDELDAPLTDSTLPPSYPAGSGGFESGATYATTGYTETTVTAVPGSGTTGTTGTEGGGKVDEAKAKVEDVKAKAGEVKEQVKGEAQNVKQTATEAGSRVAGTAKAEAAHVAGEARRQAKDVLQQTRSQLTSQASSQQQNLASVIRTLGSDLSTMAGATETPGVATNLANQASGVVDSVADWFESREPADVLAEVTAFARRRPGTFLGIAAVAGLVAGRLARSLKDDAADDGVEAVRESEYLSSGYTTAPAGYTTDAYTTTTETFVSPTTSTYGTTSTYPAPEAPGTTTGGYGGTA